MQSLPTQPCASLQQVKDVDFPAETRLGKVLVTGPPGVGKSTLMTRLGGWSEEGYLDLGRAHWWRSEILAVRPREIHLGLPFLGLSNAVSVFDAEFLNCDPLPPVDFERIVLPPRKRCVLAVDWYRRYVFEFVLPPAEVVLARRIERSGQGTHPVDAQVSLEICAAQLAVFRSVAEFLYRQGFEVYLREGAAGWPGHFVD